MEDTIPLSNAVAHAQSKGVHFCRVVTILYVCGRATFDQSLDFGLLYAFA